MTLSLQIMTPFKMTEENNFRNICNLTTKVMGFDDGALSLRSRKRPLQVARAIAGYIGLKEENIHRTVVAKGLNRDRSLMYHYEKNHTHNYATCLVYRNTFNKSYGAWKDIDSTKRVFLDDDFLNNVRSEMDKQGMPTITAPTLHQKQSSKTKKISSSNLKSVIKEAVKELLDETISAKLHESIGPRKSAGENFQFTVGDRVFYGKITSSKTLK